jgi:SAM-dependent methyltransferase
MTDFRASNQTQAALWNGASGRAWIETQAVLDRLFEPFEGLLAEAVPVGSGCHVLDVGCGTGATTIALARRPGPQGGSLGVDVSAPMIAVARVRAAREHARADFVCADAQTHSFARAGFDRIVSRFGVMFFDDPVRAFANLRAAARADARLRFVAWRSAEENPFMTAAERAAAPLLPELPPRRADEPGQFAFADRGRVEAILRESGWDEVENRPIDLTCRLPVSELERYLRWLGPVGRVLQELGEAERERLVRAVRAAFDPYVRGDDVEFTAACWQVDARAPR